MTTTLYLVRHGITEMNSRHCFQGLIDIPLNEIGEAQGQCLIKRFEDVPIDVAISSPLSRARKTMDYILETHPNMEVILDPELVELDGGLTEGQHFYESESFWPGYLNQYRTNPGTWDHPGGENGAQARTRFEKAINRIVREHQGKSIVVACHGFVIQTFVNYAKGRPAHDMSPENVGNVSVSKFTFDDDFNLTMEYYGDDDHLPDNLRIYHDWEELQKPKAILIWYPKCTTCKKARKFLEEQGITTIERHIVNTPLHKEELAILMERYPKEPRKFFNTSGIKYRELGLKDKIKTMTQDEMIELLATDGMLVKRPILMYKGQVALGFKEGEWAEILSL